jgi:hypothetical protein
MFQAIEGESPEPHLWCCIFDRYYCCVVDRHSFFPCKIMVCTACKSQAYFSSNLEAKPGYWKKREEKSLEAAQMKFLRYLLGITKLDNGNNQCIRGKNGITEYSKGNKMYQCIIRIKQSNKPPFCLTVTSDYMFRSHNYHQVYTYDIVPNCV